MRFQVEKFEKEIKSYDVKDLLHMAALAYNMGQEYYNFMVNPINRVGMSKKDENDYIELLFLFGSINNRTQDELLKRYIVEDEKKEAPIAEKEKKANNGFPLCSLSKE